MYHTVGLRQAGAALVVIGDDEFEAKLPGFGGFVETIYAAIDGDDKLGAAFAQLLQCLDIDPVSFGQPVRYIEIAICGSKAA